MGKNIKHDIESMNLSVYAEAPKKEIYDFVGNITHCPDGEDSVGYNRSDLASINQTEEELVSQESHMESQTKVESLSLENTLWANTVVATGPVLAQVVYTGKETRASLNAANPRSKQGKLDLELNFYSKVLFIMLLILSFALVAFNKFKGQWYITMFRFLLLFSAIIPISMRVNLDMGKALYSWFIGRDKSIPGTIVRNSAIPEELGRIDYLFSDKTGTLTQNEMIFKRLSIGVATFDDSSIETMQELLSESFEKETEMTAKHSAVSEIFHSIALCHNVTPSHTDTGEKEYQASSPDELALVQFSEQIGLELHNRSVSELSLRNLAGDVFDYNILLIFPFTSASKRMGIITQRKDDESVIEFWMKGADAVMAKIVKPSDWLEEECDTLAREGLRTLVFGKKTMTLEEFQQFNDEYEEAKASVVSREQAIMKCREKWEKDMDLLGLTGVEDCLQVNVQDTLENLRSANIKVWMLTGDKVETGCCIARSTRLVGRSQSLFLCIGETAEEARSKLLEYDMMDHAATALVIDGGTLEIVLREFPKKFIKIACKAASVVCCRCSPLQKAQIVHQVKKRTKKQTAAIGDGGNDVSMIISSDVGIGIVGKEGKQASLAADISVTQFSHIQKLILWHGRNAYKRNALLSQFIIHRGVIISVIQAVFSAIYFFSAVPVFSSYLLMFYSTVYTGISIFSFMIDEDISPKIAEQFPELYKDLQKGRALNLMTFILWIWKAVYQAGVIMILSIILFEDKFLRLQSISFTALLMVELVMIGFEVTRFKIPMLLTIVISIALYAGSLVFLPESFELKFVGTFGFWWKLVVITFFGTVPIYFVRWIVGLINPPKWKKLTHRSRLRHFKSLKYIVEWVQRKRQSLNPIRRREEFL